MICPVILFAVDMIQFSDAVGISWRIVGSLDTFWIALFINRDAEHAMLTASCIAITEVATKLVLYWLHERAWMKVEWGKIGNMSVAEGVEPV